MGCGCWWNDGIGAGQQRPDRCANDIWLLQRNLMAALRHNTLLRMWQTTGKVVLEVQA